MTRGNDDGPKKPELEDIGLEVTMPGAAKVTKEDLRKAEAEAEPKPEPEPDPESSARIPKRATFPPSMWDRQTDLVSSAPGNVTVPPTEKAAGSVTLSGDRLDENLARAILNRRFEQAGYKLEADYAFREGDLMTTLDGFDPDRRVGYQFISHADADIVTDFDKASEMAFDEMRRSGRTSVLVIHDGEAETGDAVVELVNGFLASLGHQV